MSDPLGLKALITRKQQEIDAFPASPDEYQIWLSHPITKHLMSTIQMDIYNRQTNSAKEPNGELIHQLEVYLAFGEVQANG